MAHATGQEPQPEEEAVEWTKNAELWQVGERLLGELAEVAPGGPVMSEPLPNMALGGW